MDQLLSELQAIEDKFRAGINSVTNQQELENIRVKLLGKKGEITSIMKNMGRLSDEDKPKLGQAANKTRQFVERIIAEKQAELTAQAEQAKIASEILDISMPGKAVKVGGRHPLTLMSDEICDTFIGLGYTIAEGPDVELDLYNFEMLRLPKGHPARDEQDTFYLDYENGVLLRSQTSPVQIRVMNQQKPPVYIVCPGRVYRSDTVDATHSPIFHQIEGLAVDENISMTDLVAALELFARNLFGKETKIRLRPHHFPFTEPSCEVDISCWTCGGNDPNCKTCRGEGYIEILGGGMVHPEVLENCGIDSRKYSGFAFGIGVERVAMGRYDVTDIRNFYENDLRFLEQFSK
ncbi:MAG: phenylalanine--tRNA ligase subunit alpha [Saccharofermentanales bacterium]